ncbi:hypothetical protein BH10ACT1_BH10ACT1_21460 [soil metagenome]
MRTSIRVAVATALLAPLALVAATATPTGAAPAPAPTVSTTSGAPGTHVDVSVADCTSDDDAGEYRFLQAMLISGTAPNQVLAGIASATEGTGTLVVPDWLDAAQPAVIEATCQAFSEDGGSDDATTVYDGVPFDVLAGPGAATQLATFSRTELAVGQGFQVEGSGCNLPGAEIGGAAVFRGSDRSGRSGLEAIAEGYDQVSAGAFAAPVVLNDSGVEVIAGGSSSPGGEFIPDDLEVVEHPTDLRPGSYFASPYCFDEDGLALLYEPELITVTGAAPLTDVDLTIPSGSRTATFAGGSCTSGSVQVEVYAESADEVFSDPAEDFDLQAEGPGAPRVVSPLVRPTFRSRTDGDRRTFTAAPRWSGRGTRALADDDFLETEVEPDAQGSWSIADDVSFDQGFVLGFSACGDPLGDGWVYDSQASVVEPVEATVPTTDVPISTPPAPPAAAPAAAVPGRPTYAG